MSRVYEHRNSIGRLYRINLSYGGKNRNIKWSIDKYYNFLVILYLQYLYPKPKYYKTFNEFGDT